MLKVTIAMPNRDDFRAETVASLVRMVTQIGGAVNFTAPQGCYIDDLRNMCFQDAKDFDSDYLLFIDTDNSIDFDGNAFRLMVDMGKDVVSGVYVQGHFPHRPLVYRFTEEGLIRNWEQIPQEPFKADATGCGLLLISKKVLDAFTPEIIKKYGKPFDFLRYGQPNMLREDPAFCWRIQQLGFELWFEPRIKMGHHKKHNFTMNHFHAARSKYYFEKEGAITDKNPGGGIDGWMTDQEREFLYVNASRYCDVVEVGSWKGRSTRELLLSGAQVYAVDHWKGCPEIEHMVDGTEYEQFIMNVGGFKNLRVVKKPSLEAVKDFCGNGNGLPKSVDMVFIDAGHDYESVKADIKAWSPKAKRMICGHDYSIEFPGVVRAVHEAFEGKTIRTYGSIWFVDMEEAKCLQESSL